MHAEYQTEIVAEPPRRPPAIYIDSYCHKTTGCETRVLSCLQYAAHWESTFASSLRLKSRRHVRASALIVVGSKLAIAIDERKACARRVRVLALDGQHLLQEVLLNREWNAAVISLRCVRSSKSAGVVVDEVDIAARVAGIGGAAVEGRDFDGAGI